MSGPRRTASSPLSEPVPQFDRILSRCARINLELGAIEELRQLASSITDWDGLIARATKEKVAPFLHASLCRTVDGLPPSFVEKAHTVYVMAAARAICFLSEVGPVLEALDKAHVRVAVIKGVRVAHTVYPDPGCRLFGDVDLVVHPEDKNVLVRVLREAGFVNEYMDYRERWKHDGWGANQAVHFSRDSFDLDVHLDPLEKDVPSSDPDRYWRLARKADLGGVVATVFSLEYELCRACLHAHKHAYQALGLLVDVAELSARSELDWKEVLDICRTEGITASAYHSLSLARRFWPELPLAEPLAALRPGRIRRWVLNTFWNGDRVVARCEGENYLRSFVFGLLARTPLRVRLGLLWRWCFPERSYMAYRCGLSRCSPRVYAFYAWRFVRAAWRTAGVVLRSAVAIASRLW